MRPSTRRRAARDGACMADVHIEIPPRSAYVRVVRLALSALGRSAGMEEEGVDDLKIAVSEACANAVMANETAMTDDPVTITWTEEDQRFVVEVGDRGESFTVGEEGDAFDSQGFSSRLTMSIALLKSMVDECRFAPRRDGGMCTTLVVNR
jgi:serine/threonine-protein kinase RsbW